MKVILALLMVSVACGGSDEPRQRVNGAYICLRTAEAWCPRFYDCFPGSPPGCQDAFVTRCCQAGGCPNPTNWTTTGVDQCTDAIGDQDCATLVQQLPAVFLSPI